MDKLINSHDLKEIVINYEESQVIKDILKYQNEILKFYICETKNIIIISLPNYNHVIKKSSKKLTLAEAQLIADELNVTAEQVLEMEGRLTAYDAAFEAQGEDDDDGPSYVAPALYLEDNRYDPARLVENEDYETQSNTALHEAMDQLDDRSRTILQRRWLDDDKSTLHELAAEYNVSAERIRQLEKNAMEKIKVAMSSN